MDDTFFNRLFKTFSVEAEEHLSLMSSGFLKLEKIASPAINAPELLEEVYREAHSLKGASRAVGLEAVEYLLQNIESYFSLIKKEEIEPSPGDYDILFRAIDLTRESIELKKNGADDLENQEAMRLLTEEVKGMSLGSIIKSSVEAKHEEDSPRVLDNDGKEEFSTYNFNLNQLRKKIQEKQKTEDNVSPVKTEPLGHVEKPSEKPIEKVVVKSRQPETSASRVIPETIRVNTAKIDDLRTRTEELLNIKLNYDQLLNEIKEMNSIVSGGQQTVEQLTEKFNRLLASVDSFPPNLKSQFVELAENFKSLSQNSFTSRRRVAELTSAVKKYKTASRRIIDDVNDFTQTLFMLPFSYVLDFLPKAVRDLSKALNKEVELTITGADIEVDRRILEEIKDPLLHIIRNSIDHGIESPAHRLNIGKPRSGSIKIEISGPAEGNIILSITDDGIGLDVDTLKSKAAERGLLKGDEPEPMIESRVSEVIFYSGVSTTGVVTDISGRGLGMSIVKEKVEKLKGTISVNSERGKLFRVTMRLPVTISSTRGVMVRAGALRFIVESQFISKITRLNRDSIKFFGKGYGIQSDEMVIPVKIMKSELGIDNSPLTDSVIPALFLKAKGRSLALLVDEINDELEIIIKSFQPPIDGIKLYTGATILGDGKLYPVLSSTWLMGLEETSTGDLRLLAERKSVKVLVVDDSKTSRTLLQEILDFAGFKVDIAEDGGEAFNLLVSGKYDVLVSDIEMPNMNGLELTVKVRETPELSKLPVILVTGLAREEDKARGVKAGANAYILKKSFDQSVLIDTINFFVNNKDI